MTGTEFVLMMVAMMLPPSVVTLRHHTAVVAAGYFSVWTVIALATYPVSVALMGLEMRQPIAAGVIVAAAGALQLTRWKARRLASCHVRSHHGSAWRHGVSMGVRCVQCCANLMIITLAFGMMEYRAMVLVTAAITIERLAPASGPMARRIGAAVLATGLVLIVRAG